MPEITRAKINIREGTVELEGSEDFVKTYLDEFKKYLGRSIETAPMAVAGPQLPLTGGDGSKKKLRTSKGVTVTPIPLDLDSKSPKLREFYAEKKPDSNQKLATVFVYYINKILGIQDVQPGHISTCYNKVGARKSTNIPQLFRDITSSKGWVTPGKAAGSVNVTPSGENLVEHDLKGGKDAKTDTKSAAK